MARNVNHQRAGAQAPERSRGATGGPGRSAALTNVVLGVWLVVAPFVLVYGEAAPVWNDVIVGVLVAALAYARYRSPGRAAISWTNAALGLWLVIAPWALDYTDLTRAMWNDIVVGIGIITLAAIAAAAAGRQRA
jgi:hypothetical protein